MKGARDQPSSEVQPREDRGVPEGRAAAHIASGQQRRAALDVQRKLGLADATIAAATVAISPATISTAAITGRFLRDA